MPVGKGNKSGVGAAGHVEEAVHRMYDGLRVAAQLGLPTVLRHTLFRKLNQVKLLYISLSKESTFQHLQISSVPIRH